jgi:cell division septum initiation protein DivIVA
LATAWYDEESRLAAADLLTVTFPESRFGRRGYEEGPVRAYLQTVHAEFVRVVSERASLWQEVQRLRQRIISGMTEGDLQAVLFGEASVHVHAVRILSTARVTADGYAASAEARRTRVTEEARLRRDDIMREAQQYSDMILEDAHAKAREAAVEALNAAPAPQTEPERLAAQAELAYLRTYSEVYRSHLRAYTEGVLHSIEEWERTEEAALHEAQAQANPGSSPPAPDPEPGASAPALPDPAPDPEPGASAQP